jgi:hypothetical protein
MRQKKIEPLKWVDPTFYLYYDMTTGNLLALTNEKQTGYDYELIVPYEIYDKFVSGREQFKDWVVVRTKNPDVASGMEIVPRNEQEIYFKNNVFEWIKDKPTEDTELSIHWAEFEKMWIFLISDSARQRLYDKEITKYEIVFFVTLESDFDFLVRTIKFNISDLILDKVCIPFEKSLEYKIDKISISTRAIFSSYGLSVWKDEEKQ